MSKQGVEDIAHQAVIDGIQVRAMKRAVLGREGVVAPHFALKGHSRYVFDKGGVYLGCGKASVDIQTGDVGSHLSHREDVRRVKPVQRG